MNEGSVDRAVAIVGVAAIMPDAPDAAAFWQNIKDGRYSISDVTADRWDSALYYDPDPRAPDKTYSKIGGWVRDFEWDPLGWKLPIPPRVSDAMDDAQKWAVNLARAALLDYGWPERPIDSERTAVVIGNAMAGENHYRSSLRINFPEFARELEASPTFAALSKEQREGILEEALDRIRAAIPAITEDTMPGELGNIIAGRVANLFNFPRPQLRHGRGLRIGLGRHGRVDRGARQPRVRRRSRRRHRPQHGGCNLREVLQDRRTVGHRHPALRRRRRRLRHG